jgi:hypothetical protein
MRREAWSSMRSRSLPGPDDRRPRADAEPATRWAGRAGWTGLGATTVSIALTLAVGLAGPSVMEPALPRVPAHARQPPWAFSLHLSPYLSVGLTAAALTAGTAGLALCLLALRRGWTVPPRLVLAAGLIAATAIALVPPFGSSDHLSYAAYGRMAVTGHDPYLTTPAMLARLGDPVARAVQDWRHSPSVYGSLATGGQALASWAGGLSPRLTVFVLSLLGLAAFAATGLILHLLTRGSRIRQLRAGLIWTLNPLLLQVLVAGAHVDSQATVFAVAAVAIFSLGLGKQAGRSGHRFAVAAAAGLAAGLAFAVKISFVLVTGGLLMAALLAWWPRAGSGLPAGARRPWGPLVQAVGGVTAGFAVTAAAAFVPWGAQSLDPALRAGAMVSIGSPWRVVRYGLRLLAGEASANSLVRVAAIVLAVLLLALFARPLLDLAGRGTGAVSGDPPAPGVPVSGPARLTVLAAGSSFAIGFAWLVAWPYVLPWYDGLAWALLALLPWSAPSGETLPWAALDWLLLARTAALAFGYLPARGITMPAGLGWLQSVVRTGVTPAILLGVTVVLVWVLWPRGGHEGRAARRVPNPRA